MNNKEIYLVCTMDGLMYGESDLSTHCAFTDLDDANYYCQKLNDIRDSILNKECPVNLDKEELTPEEENTYRGWQLTVDSAMEQGSAFIRVITLYDGEIDE